MIWTLICTLVLNPVLPALGQVVPAGGGTTVGAAGNGVPVVNIAAPNAQGLSHNRFTDYNVGREGLILNNATGAVQQTQLGGYIVGNPGLNGRSANVILNEVTGGRASRLAGYTEIAGQAARLIVANPWGLTCDGCGFINTPRVTLTTGRPLFEDGQLSGWRVDDGAILIEGAGLNASNVDQFELITRSVEINAALHARRLSVIAGRNAVDAQTLAAQALAPDGSAPPTFAIDSAALGGMYAHNVLLVGTEAGVGVRLAGDLAASAGDIRIDSAGRLTLNRAAASGAAQLAAGSAQIGTLQAGGELAIHATDGIEIAQALQGEAVTLNGSTIANRGIVLAQGALDIQAQALDNRQGQLLAKAALTVTADTVDNRAGTVGAAEIRIAAAEHLNNADGLIESSGSLRLNAAHIDNRAGALRAVGAVGRSATELVADEVDNRAGRIESVSEDFQLQAGRMQNAGGSVTHVGLGDFMLSAGALEQAGGRFLSNGTLALTAANWQLTSDIQVRQLLLEVDHLNVGASGALLATHGFTGQGANWQNDGKLVSDAGLTLTLTGAYTGSGALTAAEQLDLTAQTVHNQGTLGAGDTLTIRAQRLKNENGLIFSGGDMLLAANEIHNRRADIYSLGALTVSGRTGTSAQTLENRSGHIEADGVLAIEAATVTNTKDVFTLVQEQTGGSMHVVCYDCGGDHHNVDYVATETFVSRIEEDSPAGVMQGNGGLLIRAGVLANHYSVLASGGDLLLDLGALSNVGAAASTSVRTRAWNTGRITDGTNERFIANWLNPYNAAPLPKSVPVADFFANRLVSDVTVETPTGLAAPAVIQAVGSALVRVSGNLQNDVVTVAPAPSSGHAVHVTQQGQSLPDTSQQRVEVSDAVLPGVGNGLFQTSSSHRYLVETNPALTNLKSFLSSNYLLERLGYDPDAAQKRLGDGLYEQRLMSEAVLARTGQRYLSGLDSDEALFRQLMDNAVASKEALSLSVGVKLTAEQVAALTHDIVWLEEREVAGEQVLVPVLYLAQGEGRLAPTGALVQGKDVALIAGDTLANRGTLRSTGDLYAEATNVLNGGLLQAGQQLSVVALENVVNTAGGRYTGPGGRTEPTHDLSLSAGQDILNLGGALTAGNTLSLNAGNDIVIAAVEESSSRYTKDKRHTWSATSVRQLGSEVSAGGNLNIAAGNDLTVVASRVSAGGDALLSAGRDLTLSAAANAEHSEYHYKSSKKKVNAEDLSIRQQATELTALGNVALLAGRDLTVAASKVEAGESAYLYAGRDLSLLAGEELTRHFYEKQKKGSFGKKSMRLDDVTTVTVAGSDIQAGKDLVLASLGDQHYQAAKLSSGNDLTLDAGGDITFEAMKGLIQEAHHKSKSSWAWQSAKGKGHTDETVVQSQLMAAGELAIRAAGNIQIDLKEINGQSVSQAIDAMVAAEPQLAWLKEMEARGEVDWRQVKEVHDSFKYSQSGLGGVAAAVIAIVVAYFTAGAASGAIGSAAGAGAGSGSAMAAAGTTAMVNAGTAVGTAAAGWANVALTAGISSMAGSAAVNLINNKGNLGDTLKMTFSDDALKGYVASMLTAGITQGVVGSLQKDGLLVLNPGQASFAERFALYSTKAAIGAGVQSVVLGKPLNETLQTALVNTLAQTLTSEIGDWGRGNETVIAKALAHAAVQCAAAKVQGSECGGAALGAATAELLSPWLNDLDGGLKEAGFEQSLGSVAASLGAALAATLLGKDANAAINAAQMVDTYNRQLHPDEKLRIKELAKGDPEKEGRLTAAACAMVRCADGVPITDPAYSYLRSLQDSGTSMTAEQAMLGIQRDASGESLFRYSVFDQAGDIWSQNKLGPRFAGAAQGTLGSLGVAGSAALCTSGIGCAAGAVTGTISADYAQAGMKQAWTGDVATTYGEQVLQSLGMSPEAAAYTYAVLGMAPVTLEAVLAARAVNNVAQYNTLARASYADFTPQGVKVTNEVMATPQAQAMMAELKAGSPGLSDDLANRFIIEWLESGNSLPTAAVVNSETMLLKVVPKGNGVSPTTAFWVSSEQAQALAKMSPQQVGQALGLPAAQAAKMLQNGVEYYAITPKPGANPMVFVSEVAQTSQGSIRTTPNTTQIIVPNRTLWSDPKPVNPTTLR